MKRPATPAEPGPPAPAPVATQDVAGVRDWRDGAVRATGDTLIRELPVALVYNGVSHVVMMATPTRLEDFALGFSLSEGILERPGELYDLDIRESELGIEVAMTIAGERFAALKDLRRNLAGRTGCGLCGAESLQQAVRKPEPVTGAQCIPFHVAQAGVVIGLRLHREATESALVNVATSRSPILRPMLQSVRTSQPLHVRRNCPVVVRPEEEMLVVRHQVEADHAHRDAAGGLLHQAQKPVVIIWVMEDLCPFVSAIEHVIHRSCEDVASSSGHGCLPPG